MSLVRLFVRAERCGSWDLHIDTVKRMLPYFHAAGHLQYAKSAHLYVQQMCDLQQVMNPDEYEQYRQQVKVKGTSLFVERTDFGVVYGLT